ncbi:MAG: PAS domain S-box protein [Alphaproteobacteria bacterium]|nr:PAS domain S-box protein [Alphaproteobacteria bacterium]MCW5741994.1 PAS domain S-box protein [Alphaproteobacteria bacterium]
MVLPRLLGVALCLAAMAWSAAARAQEVPRPVAVHGLDGVVDLAPAAAFLVDPEHRLALSDVASPAFAVRFRPDGRSAPSFGLTRAAVWMRIDVDWRVDDREQWWLLIRHGGMDRVDLYLPQPGGPYRLLSAGLDVPHTFEPAPHRRIAFRLPPEFQGGTLYLKVVSAGPIRLPVQIVDAIAFERREAIEYVLLAGYCGLLLALAVYMTTIWFAVRPPGALWLAAAVVSLLVSVVVSHGLIGELVSPGLQPPAREVGLVAALIGIICSNLFIVEFLGLRASYRALALGFTAANAGLAAAAIVVLVDPLIGRIASAGLAVVTTILGVCAVIVALAERRAGAIALALGWLVGKAGGIMLHVMAWAALVTPAATGLLGFGAVVLAALLAVVAMAGRLRDERLRAEAALRDSEARFRDFANASSDWFWETDAERRFTHFGGAALKMIGFEQARALGRRAFEVASLRPSEDVDAISRAIAERRPFRDAIYSYRQRADETRYLRVSGVPIFDAEGRFAGYRGVAADITEERRAREARQQREKLAALGQLAGGVAHEINNMLHPVLNFAREAREVPPSREADRRRYLDIVIDNTRKAGEIVSRVLAFARGEAARPREIDLAQALRDALDLARGALPPEVVLEADVPASCGFARVAPAEITQVVLNLTVNAVQAMKGGGTLGISLARGASGGARLIVSDTGEGMDEATRARLFEPFFTTRGESGTGLGLSVVYGIVTSWRGAIGVESRPGGGTRFTIDIPAAD